MSWTNQPLRLAVMRHGCVKVRKLCVRMPTSTSMGCLLGVPGGTAMWVARPLHNSAVGQRHLHTACQPSSTLEHAAVRQHH